MLMLRKGMLNTLANAIQRAAVLLIYIIAAKVMDASAFGVASSLVTLAITIGSLSSLALGQTANRTLSRVGTPRLRIRMAVLIAQVSLLVSVVSTLLFLIFSQYIIFFVTRETVSRADVLTIAFAVFAISFGSCLKGHLWAEMRYRALLISSAASAIVLFVGYALLMTLAWPLPLLQAYAAMVVTEAVFLSGAVIFPLAKSQSLLTVPNRRLLRPIFRFSGMATLNGLIFTPVNILIISMITASLGNEVVGRFNILVQIRNVIVFLPNSFATVILTLMSRERQPSNLWRNSLLLGALAALVSVPVGIVAYLWRPSGTGIDYIPLIIITALTGIIIALNTNVGQAFIALGRLGIGIATNACWSVTTLIFVALALTSDLAGLGAVLAAVMLAYIFHSIFQFLLILRYTKSST